jgi:PPOX class probable F420-dependent enzyme
MLTLSERERAFLMRRRGGHLATADRTASPHLIPVCFAVSSHKLYSAIDEKPKRGVLLKRLRNIAENPRVAFLADHYEEDWSRLGWVTIDGCAELLEGGREHEAAKALLKDRYAQYASMKLGTVISIEISRVRSWGNLDG